MNSLGNSVVADGATTFSSEHKSHNFVHAYWIESLDRCSRFVMRYGLAIIIGWIGAMKFTAYEAAAISGLVANSPVMSWAYSIVSQRQFSTFLGVVELTIAVLIALGPLSPRAAAVGAAAAVAMFLTTLSFMVTTPSVFEPAAGGFPARSAMPGQFLLKDVALLGISIWLLADAIRSFHCQLRIAEDRAG